MSGFSLPLATAFRLGNGMRDGDRTARVIGGLLSLVFTLGVLQAIWRPLDAQEPANQELPGQSSTDSEPYRAIEIADAAGLHNTFRIGDRLYSGSEPATEEDFAALKAAGITTIVSVDGTEPHLEIVQSLGMRYIHIPIGYDQVDEHAVKCMARIAREIDGPIYLHCHHGKHRGPAAAAVLAQLQGVFDAQQATAFMQAAGTGEQYRGLWQSAVHFETPEANAELPELVSRSEVEPMPQAMARLEHALSELAEMVRGDARMATEDALVDDQLRARWSDQTLLVEEGLIESRRALDEDADPEFRKAFDAAIESAIALRLVASPDPPPTLDEATPAPTVIALAEQMKTQRLALEKHCVSCHAAWRE